MLQIIGRDEVQGKSYGHIPCANHGGKKRKPGGLAIDLGKYTIDPMAEEPYAKMQNTWWVLSYVTPDAIGRPAIQGG